MSPPNSPQQAASKPPSTQRHRQQPNKHFFSITEAQRRITNSLDQCPAPIHKHKRPPRTDSRRSITIDRTQAHVKHKDLTSFYLTYSYLFVCLSARPFISLFVYLHVSRSVCLHICLHVCLPGRHPVCLPYRPTPHTLTRHTWKATEQSPHNHPLHSFNICRYTTQPSRTVPSSYSRPLTPVLPTLSCTQPQSGCSPGGCATP